MLKLPARDLIRIEKLLQLDSFKGAHVHP